MSNETSRYDNTDAPLKDVASVYAPADILPDPLPNNPLPIVRAWFDRAHAEKVQPNANAFTLATVNAQGAPSARIVLCKGLDTESGHLVFYTNYESRKAGEIDANPTAAAVMHWDDLDLQIRLEGPIVKSPASESDAYFATRPLASRIGAWSSNQSRPAASREQLLDQVWKTCERFGLTPGDIDRDPGAKTDIPRPPFWGGYRLWFQRVEAWAAGPGRLHDRAAWTRELTKTDDHTFTATDWSASHLQP